MSQAMSILHKPDNKPQVISLVGWPKLVKFFFFFFLLLTQAGHSCQNLAKIFHPATIELSYSKHVTSWRRVWKNQGGLTGRCCWVWWTDNIRRIHIQTKMLLVLDVTNKLLIVLDDYIHPSTILWDVFSLQQCPDLQIITSLSNYTITTRLDVQLPKCHVANTGCRQWMPRL